MSKDVLKKTSAQWYYQRDNQRVILLDPDGWDRKNFDHSWSEERVTKEEYERRLGLSTCLLKPPKRGTTHKEEDKVIIDSREHGEQEAKITKIFGDLMWWKSENENGVIYPGGGDKIKVKVGG